MSKMTSVLAVLFAFGLEGAASAEQDARGFVESLDRAYRARTHYSDFGEIEITEELDGIEETWVHFFETTADRDAGLVWRAMIDSGRGLEDRVVWLDGSSAMVYDESLRQTKSVASVAEGIGEILGPTAAKALLVPELLAGDLARRGSEGLLAGASVGPAETCFEDRSCRQLSVPLAPAGELRVDIETGTFRVHEVEVVMREALGVDDAASDQQEPGAVLITRVRVSHVERKLDGEAVATRSDFSPPASAVEVSDWRTISTGAEAGGDSPAFFDQITVDVFTVVARIVTQAGDPVPDLKPEDLVVTVGGQELPVAGIDWHGRPLEVNATSGAVQRAAVESSPDEPLADASGDTAGLTTGDLDAGAEGRLIVVFLQNDFEPTRVKGQMKLYPGLRELIDGLDPADHVAVLSYFGHLKLWRDFTTDREDLKDALNQAFFPGAEPEPVEPSPGVSLAVYFDQDEAREVANPVDAMRFTSEALAPIPGEKEIIFFGYGLEGGSQGPMLRALQDARATTFVIDTTQADFHTLGAGLQSMAATTGGTYESSLGFARQAIRKIERTLAGHYVITIDRSSAPDTRGDLEIRLRDKPGRVLMVPSRLG